MRRFAAGLLLSVSAWSQSPADLFSKAPPDIESALRARITKFYEAHRDGKFRIADQYVAEDSKDVFFESDKRRCKTFEISKITYKGESFDQATVLVLCETQLLMPPAGVMEVKMPIASKWRVMNGDWFWYVEPNQDRQSPFGKMQPGAGSEGGLPVAIPKGPDPKELLKMVSVDKSTLKFKAGKAGSDELVISSELPGEAHLVLDGATASDVKLELEKSVLNGKQTSKLIARYEPNSKQPRRNPSSSEFRILVQPLNKVIPVRIAFN